MDQNKIDALTPVETPPDVLSAMKQLIADGANDVARLPEPLFRSHLLPMLTDTSGHTDVGVWMEIAGHGFRPIDVFDPANGEVLFRVPSLYAQIPTKTVQDSRRSLAMVVKEANERSTLHPAIGQTFLHAALSSRSVENQPNWTLINEWNSILARYGHAPVIAPAVATAASPEAVPAATGALTAGADQDDF